MRWNRKLWMGGESARGRGARDILGSMVNLAKLRVFARLARHVQLLPLLESGDQPTLIGGQAVMEGVMMRAPHSYCVAVRRPDGEIRYETKMLKKPSENNSIWKLPLLRGLATLGQALKLAARVETAIFDYWLRL